MVSVILAIIVFVPALIFPIYQLEYPRILEIDLVNVEDFRPLLKEALPDRFFVSQVRVKSDIAFSEKEFFYLTSLKSMSEVTEDLLVHALRYLKGKNKFSSITLSIDQDSEGFSIDFFLTGQWIVHKVIFKGWASDNQLYRNHYLVEIGEPFAMAKHQHSKQRIIEMLHNAGYLEAQVLDKIDYDQSNKMVTVTLMINKKKQFVINDVQFLVKAQDVLDDCGQIKHKITKRFLSKLRYQPYCQEALNKQTKALKRFLIKRGFIDAIVHLQTKANNQKSAVDLKFSISLYHKKKFKFVGNNFFSKKELHDVIFKFGRSVGLLSEDILLQELIEAYQRKGFWQVSITHEKKGSSCLFFIEEGVRAKIEAVSFSGLEYISEQSMQECFIPLCANDFFDEDILKKSLDSCSDNFLRNGFLHAKILKQEYIPLDTDQLYSLRIVLEEGPVCYLKSVIVMGFPELVAQMPISFCPGETIFDPFCLQVHKEWLVAYFQKKGCFFVHLVPDLQFEDNQVTVVWKVEGGDQPLRFGKVIIQGSSKYPFEHIVRELDFKEGMDWSKERIENSIVRLRKLGIFETIHLHPLHVSSYEEEKPIIIKLKEDDPFEIRARFGFQQVSAPNLTLRKGTTYKLGGSFVYKNPFNEGGFFRFDADLTRFYRNVCLLYKRPWLFSMPIATVYKLYSNKYIQPVYIGSDKPLYQALQQGFLVGFARCGSIMDLGFNVGFETMETNDLSIQLAQAINFKPYFIDKKVPYFFLEPNAVLNYLDDQLNPTRGTLMILSLKSMLTWQKGVSSFTKILFEQSVFIPILPLVIGLRIRFGHIFNTEFNTIMPPERFYLGGAHSIRSYEPDFTPPLGCYVDDHGKRHLVPQGGRTMINGNFEFRFPLWRKLGAVLFQDMGMLIEKSFTEVVKGNRFVAGTGFGLRYNTPIGPLSFDIGFKWKRLNSLERRYAWFLSLGQAF